MDNQIHNTIVSFIWGIADDCLRDVYVRGKYRDVILPMTVIRRLDAMLEDSKEAVLDMKKKLDEARIDNQWSALCNVAGQAFCNASPFRLRDLTSRAKKQTLKADFEAYLDGFSPNVQEILEKFRFRNQIDTMIEADILGAVIEKFISPDINLSPKPIYKDDAQTMVKHPGLDNHGMGTIFEELIRKFNEENNEEAGEHWTPRDVVELMADLVFMPIAGQIKDATYSCYDGACGTGGMLTVAQDRLLTIARQYGKNVSIHLFGQEVNPETYAICKADMLLKGNGEQAEHISYGSTLSLDGNTMKSPLRKNMGKKNCEVTSEIRSEIVRIFMEMEQSEVSMIFDNEEFGYSSVTVERPLRLRIYPDREIPASLFKKADELAAVQSAVAEAAKTAPLDDWTAFAKAPKLKAATLKKIRPFITEKDATAQPIEGEPDVDLRDTENVPFTYEGGIDAFMKNEVLPYVPDAYVDEKKTQIGYEISFTKYFYKPVKLRPVEEILESLKALEQEADGMMAEIMERIQ